MVDFYYLDYLNQIIGAGAAIRQAKRELWRSEETDTQSRMAVLSDIEQAIAALIELEEIR